MGGTSKSYIFRGFSTINHPAMGVPPFMKSPTCQDPGTVRFEVDPKYHSHKITGRRFSIPYQHGRTEILAGQWDEAGGESLFFFQVSMMDDGGICDTATDAMEIYGRWYQWSMFSL